MSPSSGPYKAGDVLTCTSDGVPEPSYKWTDSNGVVVSNKHHVTLTNSLLSLKCTATVTVPIANTCSSDSVVVDTTGLLQERISFFRILVAKTKQADACDQQPYHAMQHVD